MVVGADDPHTLRELLVFGECESLGENISNLVPCWNIVEINVAIIDAFADEVLSDADVFSSRVVSGINGQS
jgi:hypothetical protein